jgi:hypothetical protein
MAFVFLCAKSVQKKGFMLRIPVILALAVLVSTIPFIFLVQSDSEYGGLIGLISDRLMPILSGGIVESNRGYVYEFAKQIGIPIVGYGLGNINLLLSNWLGTSVVAGILSLYLNIIMALGLVGFALLVAFLLRPLVLIISTATTKQAYPLYATYFSWLISFLIHSAEFPIMFGLTYGLVLGLKRRNQRDVTLGS